MNKRMVAIWFPHLVTDWMLRRKPELQDAAFALATTERGRRVVRAVNHRAQEKGVFPGMVVADCKAILPSLQVLDYSEDQPQQLLSAIAEWCIRYTPLVAIDLPDGLLLDASGCTHLWGGEQAYLADIESRFQQLGYHLHTAMADTIGLAWAVARFCPSGTVISSGKEAAALSPLPATALRLEASTIEKLDKLGLKTIASFLNMPHTALLRRFGTALLTRIRQALGEELELLSPIRPIAPYVEQLPSLEPIRTAGGIEIALRQVLELLCHRLYKENMGLRKCEFRCYRIDGVVLKIEIGTNRPTRHVGHVFKLFELLIPKLEPDLGIELFRIEATVVEELFSSQDALWALGSSDESAIAELLDRLTGKIGPRCVQRYLPAEHYWPERSVKIATSLKEKPTTAWRIDLPRPLHLLATPEPIEVSVPIPDYPPLLFNYKGHLHTVVRADGPERIEQEWWLQSGQYRDYYCVEDQQGARYWLFRAGDYNTGDPKWFIHGFFA